MKGCDKRTCKIVWTTWRCWTDATIYIRLELGGESRREERDIWEFGRTSEEVRWKVDYKQVALGTRGACTNTWMSPQSGRE